MVTDMKDNLRNVLNTDKVLRNLQMEIATKVTMRMVNLRGKDNIFGMMEAHIKDHSS